MKPAEINEALAIAIEVEALMRDDSYDDLRDLAERHAGSSAYAVASLAPKIIKLVKDLRAAQDAIYELYDALRDIDHTAMGVDAYVVSRDAQVAAKVALKRLGS